MHVKSLVNRLHLAATLTAPGLARVFVEHTLRAWTIPSGVVDDAKVIVSELVTNSVQFTGFARPNPTYADLEHVALLGVQVHVQGQALFVEVWDNGKPSKYPPPLRDEDECGRGLHIVFSLSRDLGHTSLPDGEITWAELDVGPDIAVVPQPDPSLVASADTALTSRLTNAGACTLLPKDPARCGP
jgi:anti-sigma regulatory factor (Ser/Thr protein kinase)